MTGYRCPASTFLLGDIPTYCEFAKKGSVVVFDTETTGFKDEDDVVQLAVIVLKDGKEVVAKAVYLKNQVQIDGTEAQTVNGITDELLSREGLEPKEVLEDFLALLGDIIANEGKVLLVAHNLSFDWRMMANMLHKHGCHDIPDGVVPCCTKEFVKSLRLPKSVLPGNHLRNCVAAFNLPAKNSHDALDDARACMELFKFLTS
jgi:DNA polymerase III epsilon subunit-like protein